jgi:hypothetical protein
MNARAKSTLASYFGLRVKVVITMGTCSLILYHGRKFVVETADLQSYIRSADARRRSELSAWDTWGFLSQSTSQAPALQAS